MRPRSRAAGTPITGEISCVRRRWPLLRWSPAGSFIFSGYLDVPEEGLWEIAVTSDDGTVLEIDGTLAVNADGSHSNSTATGFIGLQKGMHAFTLKYLEDYEGQHLDWKWRGPSSVTFVPIPASAVFH